MYRHDIACSTEKWFKSFRPVDVVVVIAYSQVGTHVPCGIRQCYLPPGRGDIPALTSAIQKGCKAELIYHHLRLLNTEKVRRSPCPRLHIAVAIAINTTARGEIRTWVLSHRSRTG